METQCLPVTKHAEKVIEAENKRRQSQKQRYVLDADSYIMTKYSSVESVQAVMDAEECLHKCQRGKDIMAKTLEQNLQEFYTNIQLCYKDHEKKGPGNAREVNYQGVAGCLESNIQILQALDKKLNDEFLSRQDTLF